LLSQTAEYALRAVLVIAEQDGRPLGSARLAQQLGIPPNYLSKILHQLAREGVLESTRGKTGGFKLSRPAARLYLLDVIRPFDQVLDRRSCLLGRPVCSDQTACAAHERWKQVSERLDAFFRDTTIADLQRAS